MPGWVSGLVEMESGDLSIHRYSGMIHVSAAEKRWFQDPQYADARARTDPRKYHQRGDGELPQSA